MSDLQTQKLAERIALLLQETGSHDEHADLRAGLEKINQRLDKIEIQLNTPAKSLPVIPSIHPSQEKYVNLEDIADQIINSMNNEKACPFEPTGKPCDQCAMCNSRGF